MHGPPKSARIGNSFLVLLGCPFGRYDLDTTLIDAMTIGISLKSVRGKSSLNRSMCIRFESRKICVAGN